MNTMDVMQTGSHIKACIPMEALYTERKNRVNMNHLEAEMYNLCIKKCED